MATNEVVGIDIVARLDGFRAELAKIPDIGSKEAKSLTAQLSREIKKSERASKKAADQSRRTREAYKKEAKAARDAKRDTSGLSKAFGKAATRASALFLTFEVGKKLVMGVAHAVGEIVGQSAEIEQFKKQWGEVRDVALLPLAGTVKGLAVATADMMDEFSRTDAFDSIKDNTQTAFREGLIPAISGTVLAGQKFIATLSAMGESLSHFGTVAGAAKTLIREVFDQGPSSQDRMKVAIQEAKDAMSAYGDVAPGLQKTFEVLDREMGDFTETAVRNSKAIRENAAESETASRKVAAAAKIEAAGIVSARELAKRAYAESANARQKNANAAIADANRVAKAEMAAIEESRAAREEAAESQRQMQASIAQTSINTAMNVADSIIDGIKKVAMANAEGARERRDVELGLAILRGELQAAAAFGSTLATAGGTPVGFALAAAAAAAVGVSSKAAAAAGYAASADKFHRGGVNADEGLRVLRAGEAVLTPNAVRREGGEDAIRAMNAGAGAGGNGGGAATLMIGSRAFDAMVAQSLSRRGSVLTRSLSSMSRRAGSHTPHG